ncbi:cell division protein ZipA [Algicola sagamiensis]|uniref:cell division protein ZipA n=1 Tax=Algicola sagamiensis TaxID=163869 RepID=UPI000376E591|nr:cell division protein ZipA [Algicola sagamiensis]
MAEELRLVLIILGTCAIGGFFLHGWWTVRKNNQSRQRSHSPIQSAASAGDDVGTVIPPSTVKQEGLKRETQPSVSPRNQPETTERQEPSFGSVDSQSSDRNFQDNDADAPNPEEVIILNVIMPKGETIAGAGLLPSLLTLGLKFGEMEIFHRHEDSAGNGPVLFSLANAFNPGVFDVDNMEQFKTRGLSLFMTLPCAGDALKNFNLMHNAAKKLAEEFGGTIMDSHHNQLTMQTVRYYVEKIREFERQQLIKN